MKPILITSPEICACAAGTMPNTAAAAIVAAGTSFLNIIECLL